MNVNFNIEFACDNGDVDILSKKIDEDFLSIENELIDIRNRFGNSETIIAINA